ncbi:hypothetical protein ACFZDK_54065 [Streptomyces sp. NPDC007901]|uniref:hypothetical protein n=1 Tax=Streptomyces sp. NPDC007901 TaxID=3364785 RepID=UPI0036E04AAB
MTTEDLIRKAVQAYVRLLSTLQAAMEDVASSEEGVSAAAWDAHDAMRAAGLLGVEADQMMALVRKHCPEFKLEL